MTVTTVAIHNHGHGGDGLDQRRALAGNVLRLSGSASLPGCMFSLGAGCASE
jgi:hypothetical protein